MLFYPEGAPVPEELRTEDFLLRPLRTTDVELDYEAVMESRAMLRRWAGGSWPGDDFTLEENLSDLELHEREHLDREAFTYTVMNPTGTECLGCVYITPLERFLRQGKVSEAELSRVGDYEGVVRFWARASRLTDNLDQRLLNALEAWFSREWAFSRVVYRTNENDPRQPQFLARKGYDLLYTIDIPDRTGRYLIYG
jgi:hypothetical protein